MCSKLRRDLPQPQYIEVLKRSAATSSNCLRHFDVLAAFTRFPRSLRTTHTRYATIARFATNTTAFPALGLTNSSYTSIGKSDAVDPIVKNSAHRIPSAKPVPSHKKS